ncbi:unnamed protein product [Gordionus sp. m RMFG-2023]
MLIFNLRTILAWNVQPVQQREPPKIYEPLVLSPSERVTYIGETIKLPCVVHWKSYAHGPVIYQWTKDGEEINNVAWTGHKIVKMFVNYNTQTQNLTENKSEIFEEREFLFGNTNVNLDTEGPALILEINYLKIKQTYTSDSGIYVCKVLNGFGNIRINYNLVVIDTHIAKNNSGIVKFQSTIDAFSNTLPGRNPKFLGNLTTQIKSNQINGPQVYMDHNVDVIIKHISNDVTLKCPSTDGFPQPILTWYKNGKQMWRDTSDADGRALPTDTEKYLDLYNLNVQDEGFYTCKVYNPFGAINKTFFLEIVEQIKGPKLVGEFPINMTIIEGQDAILKCDIVSELKPHIQWLKRIEDNNIIDKTNLNTYETSTSEYINNKMNMMDTAKISKIEPKRPIVINLDSYRYQVLPWDSSTKGWNGPNGRYYSHLKISDMNKIRAGFYVCMATNAIGYDYRGSYLDVTSINYKDSYGENPFFNFTINDRSVTLNLDDDRKEEKPTLNSIATLSGSALIAVPILSLALIVLAVITTRSFFLNGKRKDITTHSNVIRDSDEKFCDRNNINDNRNCHNNEWSLNDLMTGKKICLNDTQRYMEVNSVVSKDTRQTKRKDHAKNKYDIIYDEPSSASADTSKGIFNLIKYMLECSWCIKSTNSLKKAASPIPGIKEYKNDISNYECNENIRNSDNQTNLNNTNITSLVHSHNTQLQLNSFNYTSNSSTNIKKDISFQQNCHDNKFKTNRENTKKHNIKLDSHFTSNHKDRSCSKQIDDYQNTFNPPTIYCQGCYKTMINPSYPSESEHQSSIPNKIKINENHITESDDISRYGTKHYHGINKALRSDSEPTSITDTSGSLMSNSAVDYYESYAKDYNPSECLTSDHDRSIFLNRNPLFQLPPYPKEILEESDRGGMDKVNWRVVPSAGPSSCVFSCDSRGSTHKSDNIIVDLIAAEGIKSRLNNSLAEDYRSRLQMPSDQSLNTNMSINHQTTNKSIQKPQMLKPRPPLPDSSFNVKTCHSVNSNNYEEINICKNKINKRPSYGRSYNDSHYSKQNKKPNQHLNLTCPNNREILSAEIKDDDSYIIYSL